MKKLYYLGAVFVLLLICGMSYVSLQQAAPNPFSREVCYTADFDGMQVEVYPQRSAEQDYLVYDRFILGLNGAYLTKDWTWNAGYLYENGDTSEAPQIDYTDINQDGRKKSFSFSMMASTEEPQYFTRTFMYSPQRAKTMRWQTRGFTCKTTPPAWSA